MAKPNILVIDDDLAFLRALTTVLGKSGYTVAGAANPAAAMDYVTGQGKAFDLVITDLTMPGIDGLTVLRILKKAFPKAPVIMITAFGSADTEAEARREGVYAFIAKPVNREQLVDVVERALRSEVTTP